MKYWTKNDRSRALLSKNVKTLPHKSKNHLVSADFVKVLSTEMRIYSTHVSAEQSREQEEKTEVTMTGDETENVSKFCRSFKSAGLDWLRLLWVPLCCLAERRSCPRSCRPTLPWGAEVSSPLWGGSRAAKPCSSRTSWRSTERSAHLPEALRSPNGSYSSTSTRVTLCLIMGRCLFCLL